jgi:glycosyltransferase involved in cell wall biosynthesis
MRFVFFCNILPDPCGAFFHDITFATFLQKRGHSCVFVYIKRRPTQSFKDVYRGFQCVHFMSAEKELHQSDIWISPHFPILPTVRKLNERFIKPIVFTCHFGEHVDSLLPFAHNATWAEAMCFMTEFMQKNIESRVPTFADTIRERRVTNTFMNETAFGFRSPGDFVTGEYITLINANKLKGVEIFLQLAQRFPHRKFLGVRPYYNPTQLPSLPNVKWVNLTEDIRSILQETRILLTPSYSESFCRVAFEAMYNGIPVVYTRPLEHPTYQSGSTEGFHSWVQGVGLDCDFHNVNEWAAAIERLDSVDFYAQKSQESYELTRRMNIGQKMVQMEDFCKEFVSKYAALHQVKQNETTYQPSVPRIIAPTQPFRIGFSGAGRGGAAVGSRAAPAAAAAPAARGGRFGVRR